MKLINADLVVHWEAYDDEHESFTRYSGTIAEFLDQMTDEGCPETVDAVPVVRCKDCIRYRPNGEVWGHCTVSGIGKMRRKDYCSYGVRKDGDHETD